MGDNNQATVYSGKTIPVTFTGGQSGVYAVQYFNKEASQWRTIESRTFSKRPVREVVEVTPPRSALSALTGIISLRVIHTASNGKVSKVTTKKAVKVSKTMPAPSYKRGFYYLDNKKPARWNPCRNITYSIDTSDLPKNKVNGAISDVEASLMTVTKHSGLKFTRVKSKGNITVDFTAPSVKGSAGHAESSTKKIKGVRGIKYREITSSMVVIKSTLSDEWRQNVLLHEMLHAVGLGHSKGLMSSLQKDGVLHSGDILGLQAVGAKGGCFPSHFKK